MRSTSALLSRSNTGRRHRYGIPLEKRWCVMQHNLFHRPWFVRSTAGKPNITLTSISLPSQKKTDWLIPLCLFLFWWFLIFFLQENWNALLLSLRAHISALIETSMWETVRKYQLTQLCVWCHHHFGYCQTPWNPFITFRSRCHTNQLINNEPLEPLFINIIYYLILNHRSQTNQIEFWHFSLVKSMRQWKKCVFLWWRISFDKSLNWVKHKLKDIFFQHEGTIP